MRRAHGALRIATAAAAAAVMVVAAGCGSSTDAGNDDAASQSQSQEAPADDAESAAPADDAESEAPADDAASEAPADDSEAESPAEGPEPPQGDGVTLNVWLQGDTLKDIGIDDLNKEFEAATGATVNLQEQTWGEYTTKVLAGLADSGDDAPDVLELGNTQVAQFAAEDALLELDASYFDNNSTWLKGLQESSVYDGKQIAVPYYAGVRAGIVRSDLAAEAGVEPPYDSLDDVQAAAEALLKAHGDDGSYSGLYFASQYWYEAISFIWDFGGEIAVQQDDGSWKGALSSDEAKAGVERLKELYDAVSRNSGDTDEGQDATIMAQEQAAMIIDPTWMPGVVTGGENGNPDLEGKLSMFVMPGHEPGTVMPQFLGGSDIVINANSDHADLAKYYTYLLTGNKYQTVLANAGYIPNTTSIAAPADNVAAQVAVKAASTGRFIPNSKNWPAVEDARVLQNYFNAALTGTESIDDAAAEADEQLNDLLNQ